MTPHEFDQLRLARITLIADKVSDEEQRQRQEAQACIERDRQRRAEARKSRPQGRAVFCQTTGERFDSAKAASLRFGLAPSTLKRAAVLGVSTHGLAFSYAEGPAPRKSAYRALCVETGDYFGTVRSAALWAGVHENTMHRAIVTGRSVYGLHFRNPSMPKEKWPVLSEDGGRAQSVRCVETGKVFPTVSAAARWAGVSDSWMHKRLAGNGMVDGRRFQALTPHEARLVRRERQQGKAKEAA